MSPHCTPSRPPRGESHGGTVESKHALLCWPKILSLLLKGSTPRCEGAACGSCQLLFLCLPSLSICNVGIIVQEPGGSGRQLAARWCTAGVRGREPAGGAPMTANLRASTLVGACEAHF